MSKQLPKGADKQIEPLGLMPIHFGSREVTLTDLHNALVPIKNKLNEAITALNDLATDNLSPPRTHTKSATKPTPTTKERTQDE